MSKYVFCNIPADGHVNPTLAIVEALIARGEEVIYYLPENFRPVIEATGATFRALPFDSFPQRPSAFSPAGASKGVSILRLYIIQQSPVMVPRLLEAIRAEQPDCVIYDGLLLWVRLVARILHIPAVALWPSYAANQQSNVFANRPTRFLVPPEQMASLNSQLAQVCTTYDQPPLTVESAFIATELLNIAFLPRSFQPGGESFDDHVLFVGPSLQSQRHEQSSFPFALLDDRPHLYISLGTVFNNQVDFYNLCFAAFGDTEWQVILSTGWQVDPALLHVAPSNFIVASSVPQIEILPRTSLFISHGGMNSTMESLYHGVPLIVAVAPQMIEQAITAQRVQELGLGLALEMETITVDTLRDTVARVAHDPSYRTRVQAMQQLVRTAGGYQRATDAIIKLGQKFVV